MVDRVFVSAIDLDIDSDNTDGFGLPDRTLYEDVIEYDTTRPGKFVVVNDGDVDYDGVPNLADGYDLYGNQGYSAGGPFTPIVLEVDAGLPSTATLTLTYDGSDPAGLVRTGDPINGYEYIPANGHLRLWTLDGWDNRLKSGVQSGGDYITPGVAYTLGQLGFASGTVTLFVEAVRESIGILQIAAQLDADGTGSGPAVGNDVVNLTAVEGPSVDLEIWNGQYIAPDDSKFIFGTHPLREGTGPGAEETEEILGVVKGGAFTVANINDTDGDGIIDSTEEEIRSYQTSLTQNAMKGTTALTVQDITGFKVGDTISISNQGTTFEMERGTIAAINPGTKTITLTAALRFDHTVANMARISHGGTNEIDLMRLRIVQPRDNNGNVLPATLHVYGKVRLWSDASKVSEHVLTMTGEGIGSITFNNIPNDGLVLWADDKRSGHSNGSSTSNRRLGHGC
jgi:hypothetical protein